MGEKGYGEVSMLPNPLCVLPGLECIGYTFSHTSKASYRCYTGIYTHTRITTENPKREMQGKAEGEPVTSPLARMCKWDTSINPLLLLPTFPRD